MNDRPGGSGRIELDRIDLALVLPVLILAVLLYLNAHGKLLDPLVDAGREIFIAQELASGATLYDDFSYYYPPLAPYLVSIPARLTRWDLPQISALGLTISALVLWVLYLISRRFIGRAAAAMTSFLFVCLNFTGPYTFGSNYIFPYSYGAVLGIVFFLGGMYFLLDGLVREASERNWWCAVVLLMAAGWSKLELAAFGALMIGTASAVYLAQGRQTLRSTVRRLLLTALLAGMSLATGFVLFRTDPDGHWLYTQVLAPQLLSGPEARRFYSAVTGSFMWKLNLTAALQGAGLLILHVAIMARLDRLFRKAKLGSSWPRMIEVLALMVALGWAVLMLTTDYFLFFRAWTILQPLLLILVIVLLVTRSRHPGPPDQAVLQLVILLAASMAVTSRIYLHISPRWYGFWMTLPLYLLIAHVFFITLPNLRVYGRRSLILWVPLIATICLNGVSDQLTTYSQKIYPVETSRGVFYDHDPYKAATLQSLLDYLQQSEVTELVVMPEGLMINYLTGIPNPLWYHTFSPMEIGDEAVEANVLEHLRTVRPGWILVSSLKYQAWGSGVFGQTYAVGIDRHLHAEYTLEKEWRSPTFNFVLLRRLQRSSSAAGENSPLRP